MWVVQGACLLVRMRKCAAQKWVGLLPGAERKYAWTIPQGTRYIIYIIIYLRFIDYCLIQTQCRVPHKHKILLNQL